MIHPTLPFEFARLRHQETLRAAERRHYLFRRPFMVPPVTPLASGAAVIALPARGPHTSACATRVA